MATTQKKAKAGFEWELYQAMRRKWITEHPHASELELQKYLFELKRHVFGKYKNWK